MFMKLFANENKGLRSLQRCGVLGLRIWYFRGFWTYANCSVAVGRPVLACALPITKLSVSGIGSCGGWRYDRIACNDLNVCSSIGLKLASQVVCKSHDAVPLVLQLQLLHSYGMTEELHKSAC